MSWKSLEDFQTEFLNRVDDIIVFEPLNKEQIVKIAHLLLNDLKKRARLNDIGCCPLMKALQSLSL